MSSRRKKSSSKIIPKMELFGLANRRSTFDKPINFYFFDLTARLSTSQEYITSMSSVKRRKIEDDTPSELLETKKKLKTGISAPAVTSASQETTARDAEPLEDAPVQKTFKDLVCSSFERR
jgi:hypothetical protein